jgi:hypothetical protein
VLPVVLTYFPTAQSLQSCLLYVSYRPAGHSLHADVLSVILKRPAEHCWHPLAPSASSPAEHVAWAHAGGSHRIQQAPNTAGNAAASRTPEFWSLRPRRCGLLRGESITICGSNTCSRVAGAGALAAPASRGNLAPVICIVTSTLMT